MISAINGTFFLEIAAVIVAFLGWWGALFMGRLPDFADSYLTGFVRWYTRVTVTEVNSLQSATQACNGQLSCVQKDDAKAAADFSTFASTVNTTPEPSGAVAAANKVHADAIKAAQEFTQLSQAPNVSQ
ncbi:MAG TPA: hypothetical protein VK817_08520 [Trebonia sp.]|nr:hypothetical protein [Trebonia sp.]